MFYFDSNLNQSVDERSGCEVELKKTAVQTQTCVDGEVKETCNDEIKWVEPSCKSEDSFAHLDLGEDNVINSEDNFSQDPTFDSQSCEDQTWLKNDFQNLRKAIPQLDGHIDTDEMSDDEEFPNPTDDNFEEDFQQLDGHVSGQEVMDKKKLFLSIVNSKK